MPHTFCHDVVYILSCIGSDYTSEARSEISSTIAKLPSYGLPQESQDIARELLTQAHRALMAISIGRQPEQYPADLVFRAYDTVHRHLPAATNAPKGSG